MSITATEIVKTIQMIKEPKCSQMKFLVSLANNAYNFGSLTEKQEMAYNQAIKALKANNNL